MAKQAEETDPQTAAAALAGLSVESLLHDRYDGRDSRDIFAKPREFKLAEQPRAAPLSPFFQPLDRNDGPEAEIYGRRALMLGSNNYLGLTRHPRVIKAAQDAIAEHGTSLTGSRLLNGTTHLHAELGARIAGFLGAGGGCPLSRHNDAQPLDTILRRIGPDKACLVVVDGVFSMGGDIADLPGIVEACQRHQARLLVDDAPAIGVIGKGARGPASHFGLEGTVDLTVGTFSKSLASVGGFVAGERAVLDWIKHFGRSMIFSASLPPASAAAAPPAPPGPMAGA